MRTVLRAWPLALAAGVLLAGCGAPEPLAPGQSQPSSVEPGAAPPAAPTEQIAAPLEPRPTTPAPPTMKPNPTPTLAPTSPPAMPPRPSANLPSGPIAPFVKSETWLNTKPLNWDELRGKVVMVEFWTFDCYNCRNAMPAMKGIWRDFKSSDFVLIGVHSPEFNHERQLDNVKKAVKDLGIEYPVAIDNDFANWNRYRNHYWPAWYLVDKRGVTRYMHIGEGAYDETREVIAKLLSE